MLNFDTDYILENDHIILRPMVESDYALLLEYSVNEPDIWKFNGNEPNNAENLKRYIHKAFPIAKWKLTTLSLCFTKKKTK